MPNVHWYPMRTRHRIVNLSTMLRLKDTKLRTFSKMKKRGLENTIEINKSVHQIKQLMEMAWKSREKLVKMTHQSVPPNAMGRAPWTPFLEPRLHRVAPPTPALCDPPPPFLKQNTQWQPIEIYPREGFFEPVRGASRLRLRPSLATLTTKTQKGEPKRTKTRTFIPIEVEVTEVGDDERVLETGILTRVETVHAAETLARRSSDEQLHLHWFIGN